MNSDILDSRVLYLNQVTLYFGCRFCLFLITQFYLQFTQYSTMAQVTDFTKAISNFALDLYQECVRSNEPGDVIISPLSVATALALLAQGCNGNTFEELRKGLHLTGDKATIANEFAKHKELLQKSIGQSTFSIVNQIYVHFDEQINKNFKEVAVQEFASGIDSLDFGKPDDCAQTINRFVEEHTNEKIKDLIKPAQLIRAVIVGVNAIYFNGNWKYPFEKERTTEGRFYIGEDRTISVEYMYVFNQFYTANLKGLDATALELKYKKSDLSFVIVLPNSRTGLSTLESKLKNYDLTKIYDKMVKSEVKVTIPKFKVEFAIKLNDVLKKMGMSEMFTPQADLSGLLDSKGQLYISNVVHKTFIDVNEFGTEAAAAVEYDAYRSWPKPVFCADHSFVYFIVDTTQMTPIFIGSFKTDHKTDG